jgi:hypothetical protein
MNTIKEQCTITDYNNNRCVSITFQDRVNGPETHVEIFCKDKKILKESFMTFIEMPPFDLLDFFLNNYNSRFTL